MTRPDDSLLNPDQLANVHRHADRLLRAAAAHGVFPTPIDDIMAAAKLTVVDDEFSTRTFYADSWSRPEPEPPRSNLRSAKCWGYLKRTIVSW